MRIGLTMGISWGAWSEETIQCHENYVDRMWSGRAREHYVSEIRQEVATKKSQEIVHIKARSDLINSGT